jgi:hypothetical protein
MPSLHDTPEEANPRARLRDWLASAVCPLGRIAEGLEIA